MDGVRYATREGRWVLLATVLGSAFASLDATVVNVALPAIAGDLGADVKGLQWVLTAYLLALASLILLGGSLGDRFGRRRVFLIGAGWFTAASVLCGSAPTLGALGAARALQGVGAALLVPGSLAIIEAAFVEEDRSRAIGAWAALAGLAAAIGPLAGGALVAVASWRLVFLVNVPVAALVFWAARHVPESRDPDAATRLDIPGAVTATVGLGCLTYASIEWSSPGGRSIGVVGVAALAAFVVVEHRSDHAMLPLALFSSRQFSAANGLTFLVYASLGGALFLLTVDLQVVLGYSALAAGAALLPLTLMMLAFSAASGALAERRGPRAQLTAGPLIIAVALAAMTRIEPGSDYATAVLPHVLAFGAGLALMVAPLTASVLAAVDVAHAGVASGVNNAVARAGGLLAVAVLPVLAGIGPTDYDDPTAFNDGFHAAMWITAGLAAAGGVVALAGIRGDRRPPPRATTSCPLDAPPAAVGPLYRAGGNGPGVGVAGPP